MFTWYVISGAFFLSLLLTFVLWKKDFLKVSFRTFFEPRAPSGAGLGFYILGGEEKAIFKLNKIIEAEIPKWMAKPPFSYVICFLIVCIGLGVIILAVAVLLQVII